MKRKIQLLPTIVGIAISAASCGGQEPAPVTAENTATLTIAPADKPPPPTTTSSSTEPGDDPATKATAAPKATSFPGEPGLGVPATAGFSGMPGGTAAPAKVTTALSASMTAKAAVDAVGMRPTGTMFAARFKTGETLEASLALVPGRCYTVLAVGDSGVLSMDITLGMPAGMVPGIPATPLAQSSGKSEAAIGAAGSGCFRMPLPLPIPAVVTLKVSAGSGVVAMEVYAK